MQLYSKKGWITLDDWKRKLFELIQADFPISATPYQDLAEKFGVSENEIIDAIRDMKQDGVIRRVGASIDSRNAGYVSTLVACKADAEKIEDVAAKIAEHPGVTHSYERDNKYNLWFTLISKNETIADNDLAKFSNIPGVEELHSLPAEKVYKIKVRFR